MPALHTEVSAGANLLCSQRPTLVKCSANSDSLCGAEDAPVTAPAVPHGPPHQGTSWHTIRKGHEPSPSNSLKYNLFWGRGCYVVSG